MVAYRLLPRRSRLTGAALLPGCQILVGEKVCQYLSVMGRQKSPFVFKAWWSTDRLLADAFDIDCMFPSLYIDVTGVAPAYNVIRSSRNPAGS